MREIDRETAARVLASTGFNFLRRGADLTLSMFDGRWGLAEQTAATFTFRPVDVNGALAPASGADMLLTLAEVERITWDRLPRQQSRSQIRFHFRSGELWTFSGHVANELLP